MFEIKPNALYFLDDLARELGAGGLSVRQFLEKVRPPKKFRAAWLGSDLITALETYKPGDRDPEPCVAGKNRSGRKRRSTEAEVIPLPTK